MVGFLIFIGLVGFIAAIVLFGVRLFLKRGWSYKRLGVLAGGAIVLIILGAAISGPSVQQGYNAGKQAAQNKLATQEDKQITQDNSSLQHTQAQPEQEQQRQKEEQKSESKEVTQNQTQPVEPKPPANVTLERKSAQNAKELAQIINDVIKETGDVEECYVVGAEEEVSTGGYWLSAEVKLKDAKDAWQVARNGVLAAYLNKGRVPLVKASVNIMAPPEDRMYALQVSAGRNHFEEETLKFLKNGTWIDFETWIKENQTRGGYKQYADDLWAQGPLAF